MPATPATPFLAAWIAEHGRPTTLAQLTAAVVAAVDTLTLDPADTPTADEIAVAVRSLFTDRGRGGVRQRSRRLVLSDPAADAFAASTDGHWRFLVSGGNLGTLFLAQLRSDRHRAAETLAVVLVTLSGRPASGLHAWSRALGR